MLREFYIILEKIILTVVCVAVVLGLMMRLFYGFGILGILKGIGNGNVYGFAIIIVTMVGVAGVFGYVFVLRTLKDYILV